MRKVIDAIAIISFVSSSAVIGLIGYTYLTLTNEKKQEEIKAYIMEQAQDWFDGHKAASPRLRSAACTDGFCRYV